MGPNMSEQSFSFGEIFESGEVTSFIWLRRSRTWRLHLRLDDALWDRRFFVMSWGRVLRTPTLTANDWVRVPQVMRSTLLRCFSLVDLRADFGAILFRRTRALKNSWFFESGLGALSLNHQPWEWGCEALFLKSSRKILELTKHRKAEHTTVIFEICSVIGKK